jgi:hypothetical protein
MDSEPWLRIELECHKKRARGLLAAIASSELTRWVYNSAIRDFLMWENDFYFAATWGEDVPMDKIPRPTPAFLRWLETQVAPAALKFEQQNPGADAAQILRAFMERKRTDFDKAEFTS